MPCADNIWCAKRLSIPVFSIVLVTQPRECTMVWVNHGKGKSEVDQAASKPQDAVYIGDIIRRASLALSGSFGFSWLTRY